MNLAMNPIPLLSRLWGRRRPRTPASPVLRLQALGLDPAQLRHLRQMLQPLQADLGIEWRLVGEGGDVRLVNVHSAAARTAGADDATVACELPEAGERAEAVLERFERRQRALLAQLRALPQVRQRSPHFGAGGWDPEVVDTQPGALDETGPQPADEAPGWDAPSLPLEAERTLRRARESLSDPGAPPLHLSYGPQAHIEIDFALGQAWLDPAAQRALRVQRLVPTLVPPCRAGDDALPREPAAVFWDIGLAAGGHRLMDQPPDWWRALVRPLDAEALMRHATLPGHRVLAAVLAAGPTTPQDLLRLSGVPLAQLRPFLQAALVLRLVRWQR